MTEITPELLEAVVSVLKRLEKRIDNQDKQIANLIDLLGPRL